MIYSNKLLLHICIKHPVLLEIMRHGVLRQKWRLEPDFCAYPFALGMRSIGRMITASTAAELRAEVGALNLIILLNLGPRGVADSPGNINLEL